MTPVHQPLLQRGTDCCTVEDVTPTSGTRVIGYARVSTEDQGENGGGLAGERHAIEREADRHGWVVIDVADEVQSGKSLLCRPVLERVISRIERGDADALVVSKLDRLSRSVMDFGALVERAQRKGWAIVVIDPAIDMTTANGRFFANVLVSMAQWEREMIGQRTREGLAAKKATGTLKGPLGRQSKLPSEVVRRIRREFELGGSLRGIATRLNEDHVPTGQGGKQWHASTVKAVLARVGS